MPGCRYALRVLHPPPPRPLFLHPSILVASAFPSHQCSHLLCCKTETLLFLNPFLTAIFKIACMRLTNSLHHFTLSPSIHPSSDLMSLKSSSESLIFSSSPSSSFPTSQMKRSQLCSHFTGVGGGALVTPLRLLTRLSKDVGEGLLVTLTSVLCDQ